MSAELTVNPRSITKAAEETKENIKSHNSWNQLIFPIWHINTWYLTLSE